MKINASRGFSLIELLIAISLYGTVLLVLGGTLRGGLDVWARDEKRSPATHEVDLFLAKLGEEFENSVPFSPVPFEGRSEAVLMTSVLNKISGESFGRQFSRIQYRYDGEVLYREEVDLPTFLGKQRDYEKEKFEKIWMKGVQNFSLEYAYRGQKGDVEWKKEWQQNKNKMELPFAVKVELALKREGDEPLHGEKIFFLPEGVKKAYHAV